MCLSQIADSTYHSILSLFGLADPYIIKSWPGGIFMIFYLILILVLISSLTASITSFLAARVEIKFKIFDKTTAIIAQTPLELGLAVDSMPKGSLVLLAGSTSESYAKSKLFVNTSVDENGDPVKVQYLDRIESESTSGELGKTEIMIQDSNYLAYLTYTPSLEAFVAQEDAKARDFRQKNPDKLTSKQAQSIICYEKWYLCGA